jgi:BirA family transcriptional regulator, biotin operon repressor / biotin---[acetyl-CoA-carboxylase] ligase
MGDEPASQDGWRVRRFASIDSTNRWLLDEARHGAPAGLVVVADEQTAGRGRRGRTWTAPPGSSLLMSVLVRPGLPIERVHVVSLAAALALRDAVTAVTGIDVDLKWPNDLVVGDRKLAGLLAETDVAADGAVQAVVVGLGCNVDWPSIPAELEGIATACNLEVGHPVDRAVVLEAFLDKLSSRLGELDRVPADYRGALGTIGRQVRVDLGDRKIEGAATDLDEAGRLIVRTAAGTQTAVAVGDVVHLREA